MAIYKVPQDVEAEDKLVGPLSFRQFIYAGIALGGIAVGFFLFQIFPLLTIIPLPVVLLFGALALPLRKDQPMETYLLAILRFYLKPKQRIWNPDGTITYVEITAPRTQEQQLTKGYSGTSAQERLDYLARVMDSRGWALKGVVESQNSVKPDIAAEAQSTTDVMDEGAAVSQSFQSLIAKNDQARKQKARDQMHQMATSQPQPASDATAHTAGRPQPATAPSAPAATATPAPTLPPAKDDDTDLHYNPYPSSMHQKVVHTIDEQQQIAAAKAAATKAAEEATKLAKSSVPTKVSPDIMRLASNDDLSISAIANEAHRLEDKDEVVINLH